MADSPLIGTTQKFVDTMLGLDLTAIKTASLISLCLEELALDIDSVVAPTWDVTIFLSLKHPITDKI